MKVKKKKGMNDDRTVVELGDDLAHAEYFVRALRMKYLGIGYVTESIDGEPRRYRVTVAMKLTPAEVEVLHRLARAPVDSKAKALDALAQMRKNGLYHRYPGRVRRLQEIAEGLPPFSKGLGDRPTEDDDGDRRDE